MYQRKVKLIIGIVSFVFFSISIYSQTNSLENYKGTWDFKASESKVTFKIGNLFIFNVKGEMPLKDGHLINTNDQFEVNVVIDPASLETGINKRDEHLKSEDFFYVEQYPIIEFTGNKVSLNDIEKKDKYTYRTKGKLSIRGITKEEDVYFNIEQINQTGILITGESKINRLDYNVDYDSAGMGDEAKVKFEVKAQIKK
ncbi:MAG: YceI family protein [Bacteroidales bacterium]